jgi:glyoxylase I family protein
MVTMETFHIDGMHHVSLVVSDTARALKFYHDLLGIPVYGDRPDLGFPGAWLQIGTQQIHLLEVPNPDPVEGRPTHGGRDRHVAFHMGNLAALVEALEKAEIPFSVSRSGRKALFCRDPDGNALEFIEN